MSTLYSNSIFWIDTDKIKPNPYQPRREFDEARLQDLADSIKQYGVLQPLTVSRVEKEKEDGGLMTEYELIAGERRLRASKLAGVSQVPVIIRVGDTSMMKLELAILENLQREDLNAVDRAKAFQRLSAEFKFTHAEVAKKMGKSREYVSNSLRILSLPEEILQGLSEGKISEGHTRPLLMLADHPEEQIVLFKEILYKKITVREAEKLARKIAHNTPLIVSLIQGGTASSGSVIAPIPVPGINCRIIVTSVYPLTHSLSL
jgi:ParB family chromosome partitioning protein